VHARWKTQVGGGDPANPVARVQVRGLRALGVGRKRHDVWQPICVEIGGVPLGGSFEGYDAERDDRRGAEIRLALRVGGRNGWERRATRWGQLAGGVLLYVRVALALHLNGPKVRVGRVVVVRQSIATRLPMLADSVDDARDVDT